MANNESAKVLQYRSAVVAAHMAMQMMVQYDLPKLLEAIELAHATGPVLDPTLYRQKADAMDQDAEVLRAALPLWKLASKQLPATLLAALREEG